MVKEKIKTKNGITLVSLITTVIVLCVLAATAIGSISKDGMIDKTQTSANKFNQLLYDDELLLGELENEVNGTSSGNNGNTSNSALESVFLWKSDNPSSPDYGTVIGYTANIDNYPSLRFPNRCTKIAIEMSTDLDEDTLMLVRSYTQNIKEVELPETVIEIGEEAFSNYNFYNLSKVTIPNSVKIIGNNAFAACNSLTKIIIPDSVTTIGNNAFSNCFSLELVTLSSNLTRIGRAAFSSTYSLSEVSFNGTMAQWNEIELGEYWNSNITQIVCSDGTITL